MSSPAISAPAPAPAPASAPSPAPAPAPALPLPWALAYMAAAALLALAQGLGQGFVLANIAPMAGDLGVTTTQASWLVVAYMIPRCALPVMLIKIRTQYGLRRFAEISILAYVLVALVALWVSDLRSGLVVQALSGAASAPLSTLAFLYMLEPLAPQWKLRLGLPMAMALLMSGPTLARVIGPSLIGDGDFGGLHLLSLGLAMLGLMAVYLLPLRPVPHARVIRAGDFLGFGLLCLGFGGLVTAFVLGPLLWWTSQAWIGLVLALALGALALTAALELRRPEPLLDIRWLVSPPILHLTGTLLLFRLILSEQSTGAPRLFQALGLAPAQMTGLFLVIVLATLMGALACLGFLKPGREPAFHLLALGLIAFGAWQDSGVSLQTRPEQMMISQGLIGFAGMLLLVPAMAAGLMRALARGPMYLLSFVIVFIATQSLGGMIGSGLFTTFVTHGQAAALQEIGNSLAAGSPALLADLAARMAALAPQIADPLARRAAAINQLMNQAGLEALARAYGDAYRLTAWVALAAAAGLLLHLLRDGLARVLPPPKRRDDGQTPPPYTPQSPQTNR